MHTVFSVPAPQPKAIAASFMGNDARTFVVSMDKGDLRFKVTRKALREFEQEGLHAMDEGLIELSERLTPPNAPERAPDPLSLLSEIMQNAFNSSDSQTMLICVLWLGHHYPGISGFEKDEGGYKFSWSDTHL